MAKTMTVWIALLRGINVGGRNRLSMQDLRTLLGDLGLQNVQTYIQSGNAVFHGPPNDPTQLAQKITEAIAQQFGFTPKVLMLRRDTFNQIINDNPFVQRITEQKHMHVSFLAAQPDNPDISILETLRRPDEVYALNNTAFYLLAPSGIGRSKLAAKVETALGVPATGRNWRSLMAIKAMADVLAVLVKP